MYLNDSLSVYKLYVLLFDSQKASGGENPQAAGVPLTNDTNNMVYLGGDQISFASPVSIPKSLSMVLSLSLVLFWTLPLPLLGLF
jgi:hypothetical protein